MPTLIANYQKRVFATKVKYSYNLLSNALEKSIYDNGAPNTWDYGKSYEVDGTNHKNQNIAQVEYLAKTYFLPYFKVIKKAYPTVDGYSFITSNGITYSFFIDGGSYNGVYTPAIIYIVASFNNNTKVLGDPSRNYSKHDVIMQVDVTMDSNKLKFFSWGGNTRDGIKNEQFGCRKDIEPYKRFSCGALIRYDGWQIAPDYPW